ncbi:alpha/beta fold hydrolase [Dermatophilus congolensis]|uniref:alpha/beta fold hydrolase n=1 Tax=Dermatophilus congolensis TaxID=1863 RepID=UPI001AAF70F0|nr:alpha/beta fold hydrolase [Dermatophilus congolensis]MBO3143789.1 AMP-binding protein [Dermatophilus congolensis]MBO3152780.1 AMP-binding protein [Dermatophilus congolensis]MBO3160209.1 AMP-binding protein [Dermatophilus congolensis]MBO3164065.1 AMP-binding protein [Dermatophilus congolensis]MBO3177610.1 AMP-binding protein [Dermatophilus congolensis]
MKNTLRNIPALTSEDAERGVIARIATIVKAAPEALAITDATRNVTYNTLAAEAASIRALIETHLGPLTDAVDDTGHPLPVAVLQGHTARAVATILGIIGSGHPVVVLDSRAPAPRLADQIKRTGARCVLHADGLAKVAADLGTTTIDVTTLPNARARHLWRNPTDPTLPAVLALTSGSTGTPKIVVNDQRMLVMDAWDNSLATGCYDANDIIAHNLPMAFHAGLMATIAGITVGAITRLFDTREHGIAPLAAWLHKNKCTVMQASPAICRAFAATGPDPALLERLRSVTIAGEAAQGCDVERIRTLLSPECVVRNRYGSSETGLIAEYVIAADHPTLEGALPVGRPVGFTRVELVDAATAAHITGGQDDLPPLAPGTGLVAVHRKYVASGYWGDESASAAAFGHDAIGDAWFLSRDIGTFDDSGNLRLLGRRDHSVKVRGYLVEPGEVDAVLSTLPEVIESVTVGMPRPEDNGQYRLVSYVVSSAERPGAASVRAQLRTRLSSHLVPEAVVFVDALPRTERGKLDRAALPPVPAPAVGEAPKTEWERLVAGIWEEVLGTDQIGRDSDFFELGGDSLAAEELLTRVVEDLRIRPDQVTSQTLVEAPTLAQYARQLRRRPQRRHQIVSELRTAGDQEPIFFIAGGGGLGVGFVPVVRHLPQGRPVYALQSHALEVRGLPDWSVEAVARRDVRAIRSIQPHGPYFIAGHSFGGLVALEVAKQLEAAGEKVATLMVLDSFPPDPQWQPETPQKSLKRRARDLVGLAVTGLVPTPGLGQYWRFHAQSQVLTARYRTDPYAGRVLVVVADSPEQAMRRHWSDFLSGSWKLVETGGDHMTMLRDPNAQGLAQLIAAEVEQAAQACGPLEREVLREVSSVGQQGQSRETPA